MQNANSNTVNDVRGRIFDIQKFSVHDGPGIRSIVFLKGCVLRCRWCCNPESQNWEIETMLQNGVKKTIGYEITVGEVIEEVLKDMPYYRRSGGGVTLSGGETLCQPEFARALLYACHENGMNTAVETTLCAEWDVIAPFLPLVDTFLVDIKHMDSAKHKEFTTQPNELILANVRRLAKANANIIVRVPVIPTFNDTPEELHAIASFAYEELGVSEMHILPYHRLGYDKYVGLGRAYPMGELPSPDKDKMEMLRRICASTGILCHIGG
ncbi:MAG: glycyl-radical enzyme activating protein [Clostridia bacterium]|nr:glycyl-radical enzyme activating protein [Clostridia bacterium]